MEAKNFVYCVAVEWHHSDSNKGTELLRDDYYGTAQSPSEAAQNLMRKIHENDSALRIPGHPVPDFETARIVEIRELGRASF